jgi:WD40 repeat protein
VHGAARCRALAVSPCGRWVVAPRDGTALYRWDVADEEDPVAVAPQCAEIRCLAVSPDGRRVASGDVDGAVRMWGADGGTPGGTGIGSHRDRSVVRALAFSHDGKVLVSSGDDGEIRAWTVRPGARTGWLATKAMPHAVVALERTFLLGSRHGGVTAVDIG